MEPLSRRRLKELARLGQRRHRDGSGECLVEGVRSVESALDAQIPLVALVVTPGAGDDVRVQELMGRAGAPVFLAAEKEFDRLADTRSAQGVAAIVRFRRVGPEDLSPPIVALDGVQDPGNVGTVIRTAAWFGVRGILVGPGSADPFGPKAVRASMGGVWDVDVAEGDPLDRTLAMYRARGLPVFGADLNGKPLRTWQPPRDAVLVVGSEAHGLSSGVRAEADGLVCIEGTAAAAGAESLNVAVASGIVLHHWLGGSG